MTRWYLEDEICWIADCEFCNVPMVVWRIHGTTPPPEAMAHMHLQLSLVASGLLTAGHYIDDKMRNIPDHYHAHARPRNILIS